VQALDDTNFDDAIADGSEVIAVFPLDSGTTARRVSRRDIPIPPGLFKVFIRNNTGAALGASGNKVSYRTHSLSNA
jgi:hypothetical protein